MGLFKKKTKKKENKKRSMPESEKLPELPKLPDFPDFEEPEKKEHLSNLPSFPNNSLGKKFSQNTIKKAVTGGKEEDEEVPEADEFVLEEKQTMHRPSEKHIREPSTKSISATFKKRERKTTEIEPIFIRIDKFEESLHAFEKAKDQIKTVEKMLKNIKSLKEEEEKELHIWEREVQATKQQIDKIDQDIFSKIE